MQLTIKHNFPEVQRALDGLREDIGRQATARALNRTVEQAKTAMSREIRQEFVLPAATVNASLIIRRASFKGGSFNLEASLTSISQRGKRSLNLSHFQARQTAKGVTFKIKRNGPRQLIPGAFLINEGNTVMIRVGKKRLPIKALQTINVAQMFNTKRINARVIQTIQTKFPEIFARETKYYLDRFNRRAA